MERFFVGECQELAVFGLVPIGNILRNTKESTGLFADQVEVFRVDANIEIN